MVVSATRGGIRVTYEAEHRRPDGSLVSRQATVEAPPGYEYASSRNVRLYIRRAALFLLLSLYHRYRVTYAERSRDKPIDMRYRTGECVPVSFTGLLWEVIKLWRFSHGTDSKRDQRRAQ